MKCPYCDDGVSRYSNPGFRWPCTICDGTGEIMPDERLDKHTKEKGEGVENKERNDTE